MKQAEQAIGQPQYNRAKPWQLILFTMNDVAFNVYYFAMMFLSYYINGVVGLGVVVVSYLLTGMRVFDGITDPIIGMLLDRTSTKFGKFRPFMIVGNATMAVSVLLMAFVVPGIASFAARTAIFLLLYIVYTIGYTFQGAATRAAQTALTNDPKQRPMVSVVSGTGCMVVGMAIQVMVSGYLAVKYNGDMGAPFFQELMIFAVIFSAILTALAVVGIWQKDCPEFYGNIKSENRAKVRMKDYWDVIKGNRALQMLILAASTDKLAGVVSGNAIVSVMVFGIVCGNYSIAGQMSVITSIPTLVILLLGAMYAGRMGQRKAVTLFSASAILFQGIVLLLFIFGDPKQIGAMNAMTVVFYISYILSMGTKGVPGSLVIPMIADCADYETYRTGRFVPGMMGTLFSFVDKTISAFGNTIVGLLVAAIGYTSVQPTINDPLTTPVFVMAMFLWCVLPILGWLCSIIAMKFTPLTKEKMAEVQVRVAEIKAQAEAENEA